jgi:cell division protein FtsB
MVGGRHARSAGEYSHRRKRAQRSRSRWILLGCAMVVGGSLLLFTTRGLRIRDLRQQMASSQIAYKQAWIERENLEAQRASQDDLSAIEDAARSQLGWVLPGEERVIFINRAEDSSSEGE